MDLGVRLQRKNGSSLRVDECDDFFDVFLCDRVWSCGYSIISSSHQGTIFPMP